MSEKKKENSKRSKNKRKLKRNGIQRKRLNNKIVEFRDKKVKRSYMKPYFAKYLPTEGKVEDNSLVLDKDRNKIGHITYPDNADGIYNIQFLDGTNGGSDHFTLVKLMLCSRDVQVGDEILALLTNEKFIVDKIDISTTEIYYMAFGVLCPARNAVKIIGDISPKATWVKEGDEFTCDDLAVPGIEEDNFHSLCTILDLDGPGSQPYGIYLIKDSEGNFH